MTMVVVNLCETGWEGNPWMCIARKEVKASIRLGSAERGRVNVTNPGARVFCRTHWLCPCGFLTVVREIRREFGKYFEPCTTVFGQVILSFAKRWRRADGTQSLATGEQAMRDLGSLWMQSVIRSTISILLWNRHRHRGNSCRCRWGGFKRSSAAG